MTLAESRLLVDGIVAKPLSAPKLVSDLADIAIPGGSIVADDGGEIVDLIAASLLDIDGRPNVYLLALLGVMARNSRGWRRAARVDPRAELIERAASEARTGAALDRVADTVVEFVHNDDAQTRSMVYGLLGSVDDAAAHVDLLLDCAAGEVDDLARGCALGAALYAIALDADRPEAVTDRLRSILEKSPQLTRDRISWDLTGNYWMPEHRAVAMELVEPLLSSAVDRYPAWPAEAI